MEVNRATRVNIEVLKEKKPREKKQKSLGYRELMALEAEEREEYRKAWLSDVRYIADCNMNTETQKAVVIIYDTAFLKDVFRVNLDVSKIGTSRIIEMIKRNYRVEITEESFYDINKSRGTTSSIFGGDFFLI